MLEKSKNHETKGNLTLISPEITNEMPQPGRRVRQVAPEYRGTNVYHTLYLPVNWKPSGKYPVIVEYTGGLADDEIASFWKGFIAHDHFDGEKVWDYPESDRSSALLRLSRLKGRPVLICSMNEESIKNHYLREHHQLAQFSFLHVPTDKIFPIPEGKVIHPHTDLWMHRDSFYREQVVDWLMSKRFITNHLEKRE